MSAISSIGGGGLTQFLQSVAKNKTKQAATQGAAAPQTGPTGSGQGSSALFNQIQTAVTNALQQAKSTGSTKDPNQIVEDSITSVLKNFFSGKNAASSSGAASSNPVTQLQFQMALKSAGITPQQFQNDFHSAVEDAQEGIAHPMPMGANLDVTA
jgi:hypothetical protein